MSRKCKRSRIPKDKTIPHHRGALFIEGVPETTRQQFKAAVALRKTTMRDTFIEFMQDFSRKVFADRKRGDNV